MERGGGGSVLRTYGRMEKLISPLSALGHHATWPLFKLPEIVG